MPGLVMAWSCKKSHHAPTTLKNHCRGMSGSAISLIQITNLHNIHTLTTISARRMTESAALLVDEILPQENYQIFLK